MATSVKVDVGPADAHKEFEIKRSIADRCGTLKDMLCDIPDISQAIPLESVTPSTFELIVQYLEHHEACPNEYEPLEEGRRMIRLIFLIGIKSSCQ